MTEKRIEEKNLAISLGILVETRLPIHPWLMITYCGIIVRNDHRKKCEKVSKFLLSIYHEAVFLANEALLAEKCANN